MKFWFFCASRCSLSRFSACSRISAFRISRCCSVTTSWLLIFFLSTGSDVPLSGK
ncbi:hypothetical protein OV702_004527 [Salmonella enterica]|nr:hypothetical protein [Salmonella enterica]EJY0535618.1 hypothetical protein [Salmonella enterica]EKB3332991.1 hypothetical protein [Salmonella enterica subsp. enterica serovar Chandans]EKE5809950.1 hypothetical protein [Salmonella enterica]ELZ6809402.1 hypothetical protein [Salmonella enterica]